MGCTGLLVVTLVDINGIDGSAKKNSVVKIDVGTVVGNDRSSEKREHFYCPNTIRYRKK